ncbi:YbaB/EbfC family nucleoid-associated protein [Cellulomonas sp. PS-H5]|uniref:YbaB/EbfC family nucleoid-associated protein n=1 Tax=Cellulomonas sp. PS-H5 TaxID=2820400 RepID=UPI001C4F7221|nr:YbaB/EbfC family nucleoid-associated protein [Cellulomonas sp. PS-H5]MBW0256228.1 hypothetical protein [Cellulomonas sp. PS-H5]
MTRLDGPEDAARLVEEWGRQGQDALARASRLQVAVAGVHAEAWSPGREVRVDVDAHGLIRDLEFTDRALRASALSLGQAVVRAAAAARLEAARRVDEAASAELGAHDPLVASLRDSQVRTLAESAPPVADPVRTTPRSDLLR